ncbi:MAG: LysR family transcriptional regulator [Xenophilus sp.]
MHPSHLDLTRWKVFLEVAEAGSLTKAAISLGTVQPAVSRQINALERECGGALFRRTGRGVALTELGRHTFPRVQALLREAAAVFEEIHATAADPSGEVRMGILPSTAQYIAGPLCRLVQQRMPRVRLQLMDGSNRQLDEWLAGGRLDFALLFDDARNLEHKVEQVARAQACLVGPPGDALTAGDAVSFERLDGLQLALPSHPNGLRARLEATARDQGLAFDVIAEAESIEILKQIVLHRAAYTVLVRQAVGWEVASGLLQAAPIEQPSIVRTLVLGESPNRPSTRATREVRTLVLQIAHELERRGTWSVGPA